MLKKLRREMDRSGYLEAQFWGAMCAFAEQ
jgi:hypothetical protein